MFLVEVGVLMVVEAISSRSIVMRLPSYASAGEVTRWGLFLMREVQLHFLSL